MKIHTMHADKTFVLADAHVHIHPEFELNRLFLTSIQNFQRTLTESSPGAIFDSVLFLTEAKDTDKFSELRNFTTENAAKNNFNIAPTEERLSLKITTRGGQHLFIINGKQIVTAEKLEVLALGYDKKYPDGMPLAKVLSDLEAENCLRILPWGAGKWLGSRGRIITETINTWQRQSPSPLFLGDNGNRPRMWLRPSIFTSAAERDIINLPGSDALPFPNQEKKVGSSGFFLPGKIDHKTPFHSLRNMITSAPETITPFITTETFLPFIKHQALIQLQKRQK